MTTETQDVLGGVRTRVLSVRGSGTPVLCLHGYGDSADTWRPVLAGLREAGRTAHAVDLPGFGQAAARHAGPMMPQFDDFVDALLDRWGPVVVLGNSLGAATSVRAAARRPDAVRGLVALDDPLSARHWPARVLRVVRVPRVLWRVLGVLRMPRAPLSWMVRRHVTSTLYGPGHVADRAVVDAWIQSFATWQAICQLSEGAVVYAREALGSHAGSIVECPTTVVHGARDRIIPVHSSVTLHRQIPGSELVVLPGSGHCPQLDDPGSVVRIVTELLDRTTTADGTG